MRLSCCLVDRVEGDEEEEEEGGRGIRGLSLRNCLFGYVRRFRVLSYSPCFFC